MPLAIRIPAWSAVASICINGKPAEYENFLLCLGKPGIESDEGLDSGDEIKENNRAAIFVVLF